MKSEHGITYLSDAQAVDMGDAWFDVASADNFWMRRRFEVFARMVKPYTPGKWKVAEIGCGNGVVAHQFSGRFDVRVDGFDLNTVALKIGSKMFPENNFYCYDIHERRASLHEKYDCIILFDVLEHIDDEDGFLASVRHHLKPGGLLAVNVPALESLYSTYDRVNGHKRRYTRRALENVIRRTGWVCRSWTYWGMWYVPLLYARKWRFAHVTDDSVMRKGFAPPHSAMNRVLYHMGALEPFPNRWAGTSLMCLLENSHD